MVIRQRSPVVGYESSTTGRYRVGMVAARFPDHITVRLNINVLVLNIRPCRQRDIEKPVRIIRVEHGSDGCLKRGAPTAEFRDIPGDEDVVSGVGWLCVVDGKRHRNKLSGEDIEVDGV